MSTGKKPRVRWSPRRRRPWCPGACVPPSSTPSQPEPSLVRTAFVRCQAVLGALRGGIQGAAQRSAARSKTPAEEPASSLEAPVESPAPALPREAAAQVRSGSRQVER